MRPRTLLMTVLLLALFGLSTAYVRLNVSPSLPYGLYRLHAVSHPLAHGILVIAHVPGWSTSARPFLKPVGAVSGENVCHAGHHLVIDGRSYGPILAEWRGDPLPSAIAADTCATVPPGHVFLATDAPQSLDSRYYGPVAVTQITAVATPLLTWGTVHAAPCP